MKTHAGGGLLLLVAAVLGGAAVFAIALFVGLEMRSAVAGPGASPLKPNPGHEWSEIGDFPEDIILPGNVGIGTTDPQEKLHVVGNMRLEGASEVWEEIISDLGADAGAIFTTDGVGVNAWRALRDGASGDFLVRETMPFTPFSVDALTIQHTSGNVGIGTTDPAQRLEVAGGIRLNTMTPQPTCAADTRGTLWFTQGLGGDWLEVCVWDGSVSQFLWKTIYP